MKVNKIKLLYQKEIKDILRDKKTLFMMVCVPLLLYPVLLLGLTFIMNMVMAGQMEETYNVAFENVDEETQNAVKRIYGLEEKDEKWDYTFIFEESENPDADLEAEVLDAYVTQSESDGKKLFQVHYYSATTDSATAAGQLFDLLEAYQDELRSEMLADMGLDVEEVQKPILIEDADLTTTEESLGSNLGGAIPVLIMISVLLGAMYPAIDATAGEKERGTLETLLTIPVSNFELIMSKFLAVATIAVVTVILTIISVFSCVMYMITSINETVGDVGFELNFSADFLVPAIIALFVVTIVFALFTSAVCMCICLFAKSFKEANNYATPVMLVFMFGGYAGMLPDFELTAQTATIPIINVALMMKQIIMQEMNLSLWSFVLITNVAYSLLTIWALSKMYRSEVVLFAEGFQGFRLFEKRSDIKKNTMPGTGDCIFLICITLLFFVYAGSIAVLKWGFWGVMVEQLIIPIFPLIYLWYLKNDGKELMQLKLPSVKNAFGGILLWLGSYMVILVISYGLSMLFKDSATNMMDTYEMMLEQPFLLLTLVMAVMPAIGEEILFRGFVFGSLRRNMKPVWAIVISSIIFGAFHLSLVKLLPTALLGALFAYIGLKSGSIFIGMLLHFLNNFMAVLMMKFPEQMGKALPIFMKEEFTVTDCVLLVVVGLVIGIVGLLITKKKEK